MDPKSGLAMKLDVVIPAYRDNRVLEAIQSIVECENRDIDVRIIVQIGNSGDDFKDLIESNFPQIEIGNEPDTGIFDAINIGLKKCSGDLVLTIGSDDRVSNINCFQLAKSEWLQGTRCISTDMQYTDQKWNPIRFWPARKISIKNYLLGYQHAHFALFLDPKVYRDLKYFNTKNPVNADFEFFWKLTKYIKRTKLTASIIPRVCIQMKQGGNSSSSIRHILLHQLKLIDYALKNAPLLLPGILIFKWYHKLKQFADSKKNIFNKHANIKS